MESRYDTDFHHFLGSFLNNMDITVLPTALITSQPLVHSFGLQRLQRLGESSPYACIRLLHLMDNKALPALEALGKDVRKMKSSKWWNRKRMFLWGNTVTDAIAIVFLKRNVQKVPKYSFFFFFFVRNGKLNVVQTYGGLSVRAYVQSIHTGTTLSSLNNIISAIESCCHWENTHISTKKNKLHLCSHFNSQFLAGVMPGQCFKVLTISS